jgi:hypothetical protein
VTTTIDPVLRFRRFVRPVLETGCWLWTGSLDSHGYGKFSIKHRSIPAYRFSYETFVGPRPPGATLDHLCRNRRCVNPAHLEPVANRINILRGVSPAAVNAHKTHCKTGHPFDSANTRITRQGHRECITCRNASNARRGRHKPAGGSTAAGKPTPNPVLGSGRARAANSAAPPSP